MALPPKNNQNWEDLINKAEIAFKNKQYSEVQSIFNESNLLNSEAPPEILHLLGLSQFRLGDAENGIQLLKKSTALAPTKAEFWANLGVAQLESGRYEESINSLTKVLQIGGHSVSILLALSSACRHHNNFVDARKYATMALLAAESDNDRLICGTALLVSGDELLNELICRDVLRKNPSHVAANSQLALQLLRFEKYEEGWKRSEYRLQLPGHASFPQPLASVERWQGQSLEGKTILVCGEEGYGDKIQFVRYVELLQKMGAAVDLAGVFPPLKRLFETVRGVRTVYPGLPPTLTQYDYWSPIQSTPAVLQFKEATPPIKTPYFELEPGLIADWKKSLKQVQTNHTQFKVGIVWQGRPTHPNDKYRSIRLETLLPLAKLPKAQWYSLQHQDNSKDIERVSGSWNIVDLSERFTDFYETAALISQLDLVISIDSAIAHLSGALGKPTWLLLSTLGMDWRWSPSEKNSVWYPNMRLFRQKAPGDWSSCITEIQEEWHKKILNLPSLSKEPYANPR